MAGIVSTIIDYGKGEATWSDYTEAVVNPDNETELCVLGMGLIGTSVIGTIWVVSKMIKGGAAVCRFLKR